MLILEKPHITSSSGFVFIPSSLNSRLSRSFFKIVSHESLVCNKKSAAYRWAAGRLQLPLTSHRTESDPGRWSSLCSSCSLIASWSGSLSSDLQLKTQVKIQNTFIFLKCSFIVSVLHNLKVQFSLICDAKLTGNIKSLLSSFYDVASLCSK